MPKGKVQRWIKHVGIVIAADVTCVGCGCHGPPIDINVAEPWKPMANTAIQLGIMGSIIGVFYVGDTIVSPKECSASGCNWPNATSLSRRRH
jgi:hypothetical protein